MDKRMDLIHGLQHIGIPCRDIEETIRFYGRFGMSVAYRTNNDGQEVAFLERGTMVIEAYEESVIAGKSGAVNHICFDVTDVEAVHRYCEELGVAFDDNEIHFLPFWENGVRYFIIIGPNEERVEFCEKL